MIGLVGVYCSIQLWQWKSFVMFLLTRLLDGIDGAYARATNQCTEFGGYLDIVVDFTVRNRLLYLLDIRPYSPWSVDGNSKRSRALMDSMCIFGSNFLCQRCWTLFPVSFD